jgi:hypothetical protein
VKRRVGAIEELDGRNIEGHRSDRIAEAVTAGYVLPTIVRQGRVNHLVIIEVAQIRRHGDAGEQGFVLQILGPKRRRQPEPATNLMQESPVTGAAGRHSGCRKERSIVPPVVHPVGAANAALRKIVIAWVRQTVGAQSVGSRHLTGIDPCLPQVRVRRENLLRRDIRHIDPLLQRGLPLRLLGNRSPSVGTDVAASRERVGDVAIAADIHKRVGGQRIDENVARVVTRIRDRHTRLPEIAAPLRPSS